MQSRIPLSIEVKRVLKMLMVTLCALLFVISGYFFLKTTTSAENGYLLRENQLRGKELESKNRILKQQVLEAQSINNLKKDALINKMAAPENPVYVKPKGPLSRRR